MDFNLNPVDSLKFLGLARFQQEAISNLHAAPRKVCLEVVQTVASAELLEAEEKLMEGIIWHSTY